MGDVSVRTPSGDERVALVELVNRVVDRGVVLSGEVTISVAEIDLLYVGLRLLLCSSDRVGAPLVDASMTPAGRTGAAASASARAEAEGAA